MTASLPMGGNTITGLGSPVNSTDAATKGYADSAISAFFSTGDLKPTLKTTPDAGWIMGGANSTIGNVGSGATYANANAQALYTLIWNNISNPTSNAFCPVTGGLGASAAADWAGLKPLSTGWYSGRALGFAGGGGSLTTRTLGTYVGAESVALVTANFPPYTPSGTVTTTSASTPNSSVIGYSSGGSNVWMVAPNGFTSNNGQQPITVTSTSTFAGAAQGGTSTPVSLMQPTFFANVMIKL